MSNPLAEFIKTDKSCGKSMGVVFIPLFLLMLIILGNIIKKGTNSYGWMLYAFTIVTGVIALILLIWGKGYSGKESGIGIPWAFSVVLVFMSVFGATSISLANPEDTTTAELATAYIATILPGLTAILFTGIYSSLTNKANRRPANNNNE